jgi:hypothetical protein
MKIHLSNMKRKEKVELEVSKEIEEFEINALNLDKSPPIYSPARRSYVE